MSTPVTETALSVDNELSLRMLCNMLRRGHGSFTLGFARANHRTLRDRLVGEVRRRFSDQRIREVQLGRGEEGVVTQLEALLGDDQPDAVFVYGLETAFDL